MRWMVIGFWLLVPAVAAGEKEQWYDWQGKPVEVSAAVTEQRTEADWVPGWLMRERERQAAMGRKRWSHDRGWYGYGWANGGYWFRYGWPRHGSCRSFGGSGFFYRGGGSNRWCVRVNTPGLHVNWCR